VLSLRYSRDKQWMHVAELDDPVGLARRNRKDFRARCNQSGDQQTADQAGAKEEKAEPEEHGGDRG
jgi:hypothetical protein